MLNVFTDVGGQEPGTLLLLLSRLKTRVMINVVTDLYGYIHLETASKDAQRMFNVNADRNKLILRSEKRCVSNCPLDAKRHCQGEEAHCPFRQTLNNELHGVIKVFSNVGWCI